MINTGTQTGPAEKDFPKGPPTPQEVRTTSIRENLGNTLNVMDLESSGIHVEDDGSVTLEREYMVNALKRKGIEVHPDLSPTDVTKQFLKAYGDEFKFFTGAKEVKPKQLPSLEELQSTPTELPEVPPEIEKQAA